MQNEKAERRLAGEGISRGIAEAARQTLFSILQRKEGGGGRDKEHEALLPFYLVLFHEGDHCESANIRGVSGRWRGWESTPRLNVPILGGADSALRWLRRLPRGLPAPRRLGTIVCAGAF